MNILLTGGSGQIGWELHRSLAALGRVEAPSRAELDLEDVEALRAAIRASRPDVIVNAAAYTDVDGAEKDPERAEAVNRRAPAVLAKEAARCDAVLVHFSTDYVFDGEKGTAYTEEDEPRPLSVYGRTKLEGEEAIRSSGAVHLMLRTSWVYGLRRESFVTTMLELFRNQEEVSVVDDQFGSPTWSRYLAECTAQILTRHLEPEAETPLGGHSGTYHLAGRGSTHWYGFARAIRKMVASHDNGEEIKDVTIHSMTTSERPRPARRPRNSTLSSRKARRELRLHVPTWEKQLSMCLDAAWGRNAIATTIGDSAIGTG